MKVVIPIADLHVGGGCRVLVQIAKALVDAGNQVEIVMPETGTVKYDLPCKCTVVPSLESKYIPYGDVILPNFYTTFRPAYQAWPKQCIRLSLGFEPLWVDDPEAMWTYKQDVPIITISSWLSKQIYTHTNRRSTVVNLGIDLNVFKSEGPVLSRVSDEKIILYISRAADVYRFKGYYDFAESIKIINQKYEGNYIVHLICPDGPMVLVDLPFKAFHPKTDFEMAQLYRSADVFVSTSWFEAFSLPPLEAMACETAVVTTDSGGLSDYCKHNHNSLIVPIKNPDALANGILNLLGDERSRSRLAAEGAKTAKYLGSDLFTHKIVNTIYSLRSIRKVSEMPKVSIIIPFYNCPYIDQAITSALNQVYPNFEVVVVNDGSTEHVDKIEPFFSQIRYFEKANGGTATALNAGINNAQGDYFTWLSSDDLYDPYKIASQIAFMQERNAHISYSPFYFMDPQAQVLSGPIGDYETKVKFYQNLTKGCPINGCTVMTKLDVFKEIGLFDPTLKYAHDYDMWMRILQKYDFHFLNQPLVSYRVHDGMGTKKYANEIPNEILWVQAKYHAAMQQLIQREIG